MIWEFIKDLDDPHHVSHFARGYLIAMNQSAIGVQGEQVIDAMGRKLLDVQLEVAKEVGKRLAEIAFPGLKFDGGES